LRWAKVDYIEVTGFAKHKSTASVWYRLLNCGFRLPTAAGTDAMANFASLRGPVGLNRVLRQSSSRSAQYRDLAGFAEAWPHLRNQRTFAGILPWGQTTRRRSVLAGPRDKMKFTAWLRSFVPIDHLQVICNGDVVRDLKIMATAKQLTWKTQFLYHAGGWCLLRAWSEKAEHPILDMYPYATTSPIYGHGCRVASKTC